jgi:hypothetical protein
MTTNVDITNRALAEAGSRSQIVSMTDGSTEAKYANLLYGMILDFMLREGDYDFSISGVTPTSSPPPPPPWAFAYQYPLQSVRIRCLIPAIYNPLDPRPIEFNIFSDTVNRFIQTKEAISKMMITVRATEDTWDAMFTDSFVKMFGSSLSYALQNRVQASREKLQEAISFAGIANLRQG